MKRLILCLICICMLLQQAVFAGMAPQSTVMGVQGYNVKTPKKNIFTIEGDDREYILIDWNTGEKSTFFVITKDIFPKRAFDEDNTQKFDIEDENNIGYYLNHEFKDSSILSEGIVDSIDNEHVWETEAGYKTGNCPDGYSVKCGICLMSQTEWLRYYPQFGLRDDLEEKYTGWWLRTAYGQGGTENAMLIVKSLPAEIGRTNTWDSDNPMYVRPVFYLNKDIFLKNKLNVKEAGSRVKRAVNSLYTDEELSAAGYSNEEIKDIRNYYTSNSESIEISLNDEYIGNIMNPDQLKIKVDINITGQTAKRYTITADAGGKIYTKEIQMTPDNEKNMIIPLDNPPKGSYELEVRITDGERIAEQQYIPITIIDDYEPQPLDELSCWGFSAHFGLENRSNETDAVLMQKMGAKQIRDELSWHKTEKIKDVFDFSRHDGWVESAYSKGIDVVAVLNSNNDLYSGANNVPQIGIQNTYQLDGYLRYVKEIATHYPQITKFEVWNEPFGNNFWRPTANSYDYTNTLKAAYEVLKKNRPDSYIMAFSGADFEFIEECFENGAYPYLDSASIHPYQSSNPAESLQFTHAVKNTREVIWKYGGWKEIDITEMGFANNTGPSGSSESWSALQQVKSLIIAKELGIENYAIYDFRNDGTNPDNREDNYGNIKYDYKGKKGYAALAQIYQEIGGSPCIGNFKTQDGADIYVFDRNGEPIITAWHGAGKSTVDFGSGITVKDLYGNVISKNGDGNITLKNDLVYIENVSDSWFAKAAKGSFLKAEEEYRLKYGDQEELISKSEAAFDSDIKASELKALLEEYRKLGLEIISDETPLEASKKTDLLYRMATPLFSLYGTVAEYETCAEAEKYEIYKDTIYAKNINRRSREIYKKAQTASKYSIPQILRYSYAKQYESAFLGSWAQALKTKEHVKTDIILQLFYGQFSGFTGENKSFDIIVKNLSDEDFSGILKVENEAGNNVGDEVEISVKKGQTADFSVTAPLDASGTESVRTFVLYDSEGNEIQRVLTRNELKSRIEAELLYAEDSIENLKNLNVMVKNLSEDSADVYIELSGNEDLVLDGDEKKVSISGGETRIVSIPIKEIKDTPYHFYTVNMKIRDKNSNILYDEKTPLGFCIASKAEEDFETVDFTGDMTMWQDAYPFYLNPPQDMENKYAWTTSDTAARGFLKWNDEALYLLADVYDDTQLNVNNGVNLWNGDCLQISIDPLNTKSESYDSDDYEYGFADGTQGKEAYLWQSPSGETPVRAEIFNVIRDEDNKVARFLVKFTPEDISGLSFTEGSEFGFNMSYNDADVIAREKWIQLTSGTADFKGPYLYHTFKMDGTEQKRTEYDDPDEHFITKISGSTNEEGFTDISGHWAEVDIMEANELGLLNCFKATDEIRPEAEVTRAELSAMLVNGMQIAPKNDSKYLEDVPSGKWYTTIMYSALFQGIINENMLDGYRIFPEKALTREEMAVMGGSAWATKELWYDTEELLFSDKDSISDWAVQKIEIAAYCGFINNNSGEFKPDTKATRAQAISMVMRMVRRLSDVQ